MLNWREDRRKNPQSRQIVNKEQKDRFKLNHISNYINCKWTDIMKKTDWRLDFFKKSKIQLYTGMQYKYKDIGWK